MEEIKTEENFCCAEKKKDQKRIKNLLSALILLSGLFIGSLFVDSAQLAKGGGFSVKNMAKSDVFEAGGKTWVAYSEPAVSVSVINDDSCEKCDVSEALVWLRRVVPTISTQKVAYDSKEGKQLIEKYGIKTLPAFVFADTVSKTEFYTQAKVLFDEKEGSYVLNTQELGLPAGKYLTLPSVNEGDATFGNADSKVKVFVFSDYQCPYCKVFYKSLRDTMKGYEDKVFFDYKHLPLTEIHPQADNAALAAECALEQGKFWEYSDKLYDSQADWGKAKDTTLFKTYARSMGLNASQFNQCLDNKKYQDKIEADKKEAADFGVSGTPAVFVNDQFSSGALSVDDLKKSIDEQLEK